MRKAPDLPDLWIPFTRDGLEWIGRWRLSVDQARRWYRWIRNHRGTVDGGSVCLGEYTERKVLWGKEIEDVPWMAESLPEVFALTSSYPVHRKVLTEISEQKSPQGQDVRVVAALEQFREGHYRGFEDVLPDHWSFGHVVTPHVSRGAEVPGKPVDWSINRVGLYEDGLRFAFEDNRDRRVSLALRPSWLLVHQLYGSDPEKLPDLVEQLQSEDLPLAVQLSLQSGVLAPVGDSSVPQEFLPPGTVMPARDLSDVMPSFEELAPRLIEQADEQTLNWFCQQARAYLAGQHPELETHEDVVEATVEKALQEEGELARFMLLGTVGSPHFGRLFTALEPALHDPSHLDHDIARDAVVEQLRQRPEVVVASLSENQLQKLMSHQAPELRQAALHALQHRGSGDSDDSLKEHEQELGRQDQSR